MAGSLNIGLRHWLPLIAVGWVIAGAVLAEGRCTRRPAGAIAIVIALLVTHAGASIASRPHYLAHFNILAGPEERRHALLVDSNLDWGQGLPELTEWLRKHQQGRPLYLSYFGSDDPAFYDLPGVQRFGDLPFSRRPRIRPAPLGPGLYALGATQLQRVYSYVRGPWTPERERLYQELRVWLEHQAKRLPGAPVTTREGRVLTPDELDLALSDYDALVLGRITHRLEKVKPLAVLGGGAMLIYELGAGDLGWVSGDR